MAKQPKTISRTEPPALPVEPAGTTTAASVPDEPSPSKLNAGEPAVTKAVVESFNKEPIVPVPPAKKHPLDLNPLATPKHVFSWERAEQKETKP